MLTVDGSQKSGSGTIVRYSVALAALLGQELRMTNIRAKRTKPGLRAQHLKALQALAELIQGRLEGAREGAMEIVFKPGAGARGGEFRWDIGTAGSTTLLAQTLLPVALFAGKPLSFTVSGGLFQDFAPSALHMQRALLPTLAKMGASFDLKIVRPGYVPRGGGILEMTVSPLGQALKPLVLPQQGKVVRVDGMALSSRLRERQVSHRMAEACAAVLRRAGHEPQIDTAYDDTALQAGAALAVFAHTDAGCVLGADMAGAPGRRSEDIGRRVAAALLADLGSGASTDRHLADQVIMYAALAEGESEYLVPEVTEHVDSNLWLVQSLLGVQVDLQGNRLRIKGAGIKPK